MEEEFYELRPNMTAMTWYRFFRAMTFSLLLHIPFIIYFAVKSMPTVSILLFFTFVIFLILSPHSIWTSYNKEIYIFYPDRIVKRYGGVYSDKQQIIKIKNITYLTLATEILERKIFGTGDVMIESAGSGNVKLKLNCMDNPEEVLDYVEELMNYNKINIKRTKNIVFAKPEFYNTLVRSLLIFGAFPPSIIAIPFIIMKFKAMSYAIDSHRVILKEGVFYKKQTSIMVDELDRISYYQGKIHQMLNNGNIEIKKMGSKKPSLIIMDVNNYMEVYDRLKGKI